MEPTHSTPHKFSLATFLLLLGLVLWVSAQMVRPYLLAVVMGGIIALLCRPVYLKLKGKKRHSKIASTIVTFLLIFTLIAPCSLFAFLSVKQGIAVAHSISENDDFSLESVTGKLADWPIIRNFVDDPQALQDQIKAQVKNGAKGLSSGAIGIVATAPEFILQFALTFISCFFFLIDGPAFLAWIAKRVPLEASIRIKLSKAFKDTTLSVIWATLAAAGAQGALMFVTYLILGVPAAFLAGGATFIFAWIPMIGSVPVWVAGAIYLFIQGSTTKVVIMVILGLITGVIDNLIRPMILKGRDEMHPLVSLVAIFGGIQMFGILGVFIGPIIAAILISLIDVLPDLSKTAGTNDH